MSRGNALDSFGINALFIFMEKKDNGINLAN